MNFNFVVIIGNVIIIYKLGALL